MAFLYMWTPVLGGSCFPGERGRREEELGARESGIFLYVVCILTKQCLFFGKRTCWHCNGHRHVLMSHKHFVWHQSCFWLFVVCRVEKLGYDVPVFDFRLLGVTSMSADIHKYGLGPKVCALPPTISMCLHCTQGSSVVHGVPPPPPPPHTHTHTGV